MYNIFSIPTTCVSILVLVALLGSLINILPGGASFANGQLNPYSYPDGKVSFFKIPKIF